MKRLCSLFFLSLVVLNSINAQDKKEKDINAIKKMCGCYEVTFNFTETFNYSSDSLYKPSENKIASAFELATLIEDKDKKLSIQHILQAGDPSKPHIVKHWRQDWMYENTDFYMFNGDNNWNYISKAKKEVKGQWTQKVYQVDDSPRYEGSATWVHVDGKSYWENITDAPLPRREYTKRNDYNVTERGNRQEITDFGWIHDQDNTKVIRESGKEDVVLAKEKGYNTYVKVGDEKCAAAKEWWTKNENKWASVRKEWNKVYSQNKNLALEQKVDNKALYKHLFAEDFEMEKLSSVINSFVKK